MLLPSTNGYVATAADAIAPYPLVPPPHLQHIHNGVPTANDDDDAVSSSTLVSPRSSQEATLVMQHRDIASSLSLPAEEKHGVEATDETAPSTEPTTPAPTHAREQRNATPPPVSTGHKIDHTSWDEAQPCASCRLFSQQLYAEMKKRAPSLKLSWDEQKKRLQREDRVSAILETSVQRCLTDFIRVHDPATSRYFFLPTSRVFAGSASDVPSIPMNRRLSNFLWSELVDRYEPLLEQLAQRHPMMTSAEEVTRLVCYTWSSMCAPAGSGTASTAATTSTKPTRGNASEKVQSKSTTLRPTKASHGETARAKQTSNAQQEEAHLREQRAPNVRKTNAMFYEGMDVDIDEV